MTPQIQRYGESERGEGDGQRDVPRAPPGLGRQEDLHDPTGSTDGGGQKDADEPPDRRPARPAKGDARGPDDGGQRPDDPEFAAQGEVLPSVRE